MITKQRTLFYFVGDKAYSSLEEAQIGDLQAIMPPDLLAGDGNGLSTAHIAKWMVAHSKEIVDTLTTTPRSRLKARKIHGGTKKRKQQPAITNNAKPF